MQHDTLDRTRRRRARRAGTRAGLAASVVGVLVLAGCGGASSGGGSSSAGAGAGSGSPNGASAGSGHGGDIVWWNMWSGAYATMTKQMASQFDAAHPGDHVTVLNVPSADGDAKLLSAIAAGDPPDVFTEWNPTIGADASNGAIQPLDKLLVGKYKGLKSWMYPVVLQGGLYKGKLYAVPMSMNSEALYYNKSMLKAAGISSPPKTLAQLDTDQAKEWKSSGSHLEQVGFYPLTAGFELFNSYFGVANGGYAHGKYDLASNPRAQAEMSWLASYSKYSYSSVSGLNSAIGQVGGGSVDLFSAGKEGFDLTGPWEAASTIPDSNPAMEHNFGVVPFPTVPGGPTTPTSEINGNYNFIPKGAKNANGAFQLITWLAGYDNPAEASYLPKVGWMPPSPELAKAPTFVAWEKKDSYVKSFLETMLSRSSEQMPLNPRAAEYTTAVTNATQSVATHKMSPQKALAYIDSKANGS